MIKKIIDGNKEFNVDSITDVKMSDGILLIIITEFEGDNGLIFYKFNDIFQLQYFKLEIDKIEVITIDNLKLIYGSIIGEYSPENMLF
jgi:hypothetical protein